ncbi:Imm1 family immunity protein [Kribbella sp. NPDC056861]|uniref:Imm1 family immunity protein n=1 Tax=Kribbella sp. NPDC056861 TaxID=3154857 RepID=UPI00341C7F07
MYGINPQTDGGNDTFPVAEAYFDRTHGARPFVITSATDIMRLIENLAHSANNSIASIYIKGRLNRAGVPDHELQLAVKVHPGDTGGLRYTGEDGVFLTCGGNSAGGVEVYQFMGNEREFPRNFELPLKEIRTAVNEFLESGGDRPASVQWTT